MMDDGFPISRRAFGVFGLLGMLGVLSACNDDGASDDGVSASAGKSGERTFFRDILGWVGRSVEGERGLTLAFVPNPLDIELRHKVAANNGVYPLITDQGQMLEMHLGLDIAPDARLVDDTIRLTEDLVTYLQLTFWNFEEPTPVLKIPKADFASNGIEFVGLDGHFKRGGWAIGTARGIKRYQGLGKREEPYYWNLEFQTSLD